MRSVRKGVRYQAGACRAWFQAHGGSTAARWHARITFCPVCLLEFHTRDRVIAHFSQSSVCRMNLLLNHPCLGAEEFEAL